MELAASPVGGVIFQLLGLDPFAVLAMIAGLDDLIAVGEDIVLADQLLLQVRHRAASRAFGLSLAEMRARHNTRWRLTSPVGRPTAAVAGLGLVDAARRIGIVLDVAFYGVELGLRDVPGTDGELAMTYGQGFPFGTISSVEGELMARILKRRLSTKESLKFEW